MKFRAAVVRELERVRHEIRAWRDDGVEVEDADGAVRFHSLANVYRDVLSQSPDEPATVVREYFRRVLAAEAGRPTDLPTTIAEAADRLRLRIGLPHPEAENAPWSTPIPGAEELVLSLVFDYPTMVAYVTPAMVAQSGESIDHWVRVAKLNVGNSTPDDWLQVAFEEQGILVGKCDHTYDAARALVFTDLTDSDAAGWLVAIPGRDVLYARKVEPAGVPYFHILKMIATDAVAKLPDPINDNVYWVRPGQPWVNIPVDVRENNVSVYPPPEFVELLNITVTNPNEVLEPGEAAP